MVNIFYDGNNKTAHFEDENIFFLQNKNMCFVKKVDDTVIEYLIVNSYLAHDIDKNMLMAFIEEAEKDLHI